MESFRDFGAAGRYPSQALYKTRMCQNFALGSCAMGEVCRYAHTPEELKKTKLCKHFEKGECRNGARCTFAHGEAELFVPPAGMAAQAAQAHQAGTSAGPVGENAGLVRKTKLCQKFKDGICPFGSECHFAHDLSELKKTKMCDHFARGRCRNGSTCTFAHGEDELYIPVERDFVPPRPAASRVWESSTEPVNGVFHKTKLCRKFLEGGCSYGARCSFAHGTSELKAVAAASAREEERSSLLEDGQPPGEDSDSDQVSSADSEVQSGTRSFRCMASAIVEQVCGTKAVLQVRGQQRIVALSCFADLWFTQPFEGNEIAFPDVSHWSRHIQIVPHLRKVGDRGMSNSQLCEFMESLWNAYCSEGAVMLSRLQLYSFPHMEYALQEKRLPASCILQIVDLAMEILKDMGSNVSLPDGHPTTPESSFILHLLKSSFVRRRLPEALSRGELPSERAVHFIREACRVLPAYAFLLTPFIEAASSASKTGSTEMLLYVVKTYNELLASQAGYVNLVSWSKLVLAPQLLSGDLSDLQSLPEVKWSYDTFEEYMDTYFRLLRADCFASLQSGVQQFIAGKLDPRDLRVYHARMTKIHVLKFSQGLVATIRCQDYFGRRGFPPSALMQSNLVCISVGEEPFHEVLWGRIVERPSDTRKDSIEVSIQFPQSLNRQLHSKTLLMKLFSAQLLADSPVFFQAFGPVLDKLQGTTEATMPLKRVLLGQRQGIREAAEQLPWSESALTSLRGTVERRERTFDEAQLKALEMMLQSTCCCIQGPPGTGKSFLAVEACRHLLHGSTSLSNGFGTSRRFADAERAYDSEDDFFEDASEMSDESGPPDNRRRILVLTYKNHANDEFLVDCQKHMPLVQVVRIGGRCEDDRLQGCNLKTLAAKQKKDKVSGTMAFKLISDKKEIIDRLQREMSCLEAEMDPSKLFAARATDQQICSLLEGCPNKQRGHVKHHESLLRSLAEGLRPTDSDLRPCCKHWLPKRPEPKPKEPKETKVLEDVEAEEVALERQAFAEQTEKLCTLNLEECLGPTLFLDAAPLSVVYSKDVWALRARERAGLLGTWLEAELSNSNIFDTIRECDRIQERLTRIEQDHQQTILREASIVGCTISGASIRGDLLKKVNFDVVIVEEAAEILESQLVAAVPSTCRQLILVGDHLQLRPKIENHLLGKQLNFDRSMFERLLLHKQHDERYPQKTLTLQNRMRDDFLCLLRPHYPDLKSNLMRVSQNEQLSCVTKPMYFLRMRSLSETESEIGRSKMNRPEADVILAFIAHILHEGYEQSDITVLASYNGQVNFLRRQLRDRQLTSVVCSSIDRYQGDENRFVLVSLVRSNDADEIGFLREPNRLIVAASRARCGVFFFGNDLLLAKKSRDWDQLLRVMAEREEVGDKLPVICPRHPHIPLDLGQECHHVCKATLPCGHTCQAHCHRDGFHPPCKQPAIATLRCGHDKACECSARDQADEILKCHEVVNFHHEGCGHQDIRRCCDKPKPCTKAVRVQCSSCSEWSSTQCHVKSEGNFQCRLPCKKVMKCGHPCSLPCFQDCDLALDDCKLCAQELEDTKREQMAKVQELLAQLGDPGFFHVEKLLREQQPLDFDTLTSSVASFFSTSGFEAEIQLAQRVKNTDLERQFYRGHELVTAPVPEGALRILEVASLDVAQQVAKKGLGHRKKSQKGMATFCDFYKSYKRRESAPGLLTLVLCRVQTGRVYTVGSHFKHHHNKWEQVNKPPATFDSAFNSDTACLRLFRLSVGLPKYILQVQLKEVTGSRPPHWSGAECPAHSERFWKLSVASELEQQALGKALAPGSSLGGRDMHVHGEHSGFRLKIAWRLEHDVLWKEYMAARTKVQVQMESLRKQGACFAKVDLRKEYSTLLRELPVHKTKAMDEQINEVYLSHGTKPEVLLTILQNGLNERFSRGLFGNGTYFAEDVGKNDQYCAPDHGGQNPLQKVLYHELKIPPAYGVFYVLFCRVILGSPVRTQDGEYDMDQRPQVSVWSSEQRELAAIPKSSPPINFHSLLAEKGGKLKRYRELIVYHGTHIYPEYVVAYQRI